MNSKCPFCESYQIKKLESIISPFNQKNYELLHCSQCDLQFFTPLLFENIYESEIIEEYVNFHQGRTVFPPWTQELLKTLKKLNINLSEKTFLEIGAGDCINYVALNQITFVKPECYYALELDSKSIEQCKLRGIKNIIHSTFESTVISKFNKKFDIILILEVFEHQIAPKAFMKSVFDLLTPNGLVIITVPNRERFFLKMTQFQGDLPPHHFLRFNKNFFKNNFRDHLYYIKDFKHEYKVANIKQAAIKLTLTLKLSPNFWFFFLPLVPLVKFFFGVLAHIRGEGIIVFIKNNI